MSHVSKAFVFRIAMLFVLGASADGGPSDSEVHVICAPGPFGIPICLTTVCLVFSLYFLRLATWNAMCEPVTSSTIDSRVPYTMVRTSSPTTPSSCKLQASFDHASHQMLRYEAER